jgi:hypothetical protein
VNKIIVSLSVGTCVLLFGLVFVACGTMLVLVLALHQKPDPRIPFKPKTGSIGEIERTINDIKYGPVNLDAAKEIKNGLFDRIRDRRQAKATVAQSPYCQPCPTTYLQPIQATVDPYDCTASYVITQQPATIVQASGVSQSVIMGKEYPASEPIANPLESECDTCESNSNVANLFGKSTRSELKTGSFLCSNCRKSTVGEWHTDWKEDGMPITFLCESCYQRMTPDQRMKSYQGYVSRQLKSSGKSGLLHQEIGK